MDRPGYRGDRCTGQERERNTTLTGMIEGTGEVMRQEGSIDRRDKEKSEK